MPLWHYIQNILLVRAERPTIKIHRSSPDNTRNILLRQNCWFHRLPKTMCTLLIELDWCCEAAPSLWFHQMKISTSILVSCICLFVSVCLFAHYRLQFKSNLHQTSHTRRHQLFKSGNSPASASGYRTLLKDSSTLWGKAFCNIFNHIAG